MRTLLVLLAYSLRRVWILVIAIGLLLAIFQLLMVIVAKSIQEANGFEELADLIPPFARALMGPAFAGFMSFGGIVCLGYFHLAVMGSLVGLTIALATMPASEVETGFMDLILSRPVARHWIVVRSILLTAVSTNAILALMMAGTWVGLQCLAPPGADWPRPRLILSLAINLSLLMLSWSGIAMAIAAASRRRSVAGTLAGLLALATFLLDYIARAWSPAQSIWWLSPFRYYNPLDLIIGSTLSNKNLLVLGGTAASGFALAFVLFSRRDISH